MSPLKHRERASGLLVHLTSLPNSFPIGDIGPSALKFLKFLKETGQSYWQVLPLTPTSLAGCNSPYMSDSAFALNRLLISPEVLYQVGLIGSDLIERYSLPGGVEELKRVNYFRAYEFKSRVLQVATERFIERGLHHAPEFLQFLEHNYYWLEDYALYRTAKNLYKGKPWYKWDTELRERKHSALEFLKYRYAYTCLRVKVEQYLLQQQWETLKANAEKLNIKFIGDMPIYVSHDSADVWANQHLFKLDARGYPTVVAGAPPDAFSDVGQLWGNPIYNWDMMHEEGYKWWIDRFKRLYELVHLVRLDHFRGFVKYWEIPAGSPTAVSGYWVDGPRELLFKALEREFGKLEVIVEDLGVITPDVVEMRDELGYPGMKVLVFAFDDDNPDNPYKPHNYVYNCVAYTTTHDTPTAVEWYENLDEVKRKRYHNYMPPSGEGVNWDLIRLVMMSVAKLTIIQLQDLLGLGAEARMNRPNTSEGNWEWRVRWEDITEEIMVKLRDMTITYGRASDKLL